MPSPHNRLIQLLADNRNAQGRRFEVVRNADSKDEVDIFIYEAIVGSDLEAEWWGGVSAQAFVKALRTVTEGTIHLRINSPGGDVFAARAIETALREHSARVIVHIDGLAASAATFIAMAGDEVVIADGAMFMIHKAWTFAWGNADDLVKTVSLLEKIDGTLVDTYAKRTGQGDDRIRDWMADETWFTAGEAVQYGFADRVASADRAEEATPENQARWNLNAFLARVSRPAGVQTSALTQTAGPDELDDGEDGAEIAIRRRASLVGLAPSR